MEPVIQFKPLFPHLKRTLFFYFLLMALILFSNYRLPSIKVTSAPQATPLMDIKNSSFFINKDLRELLYLEAQRVKPPVKIPVVSILKKAKVAIIIDDVGYDRIIIQEIAKLPIPLTWSFLPYTPYEKECLAEAKEHGFGIILHLPLEPLNKAINPGPGVIRHDWNEAEIEIQLNRNLETVPGAVGMNNHMGSLGTQDPHLMACLMKIIHKKRLFFIDSMTTAKSVAGKYALEYQVPFAKRRVFIDNSVDENSKKAALRELLRIALKDGFAIGIAHVKTGNAAVINEMLPEFHKAGIEFVPVAELVK
jgi:polysaccharide deacetylase 2 family uncharacterized protein YibQ